jgi:hypothetical protein
VPAPNSTYVQALTHSIQNYVRNGDFADAIFNANKTLKMMKQLGGIEREDGGYELVVQVEYSVNDTAGWIGEYGPYDTRPQDNFTAANFGWRNLVATVDLTNKEIIQNQGRQRIANLFQNKIKNAQKSLMRQMNDAIFSDGTDALKPIGLQAIVTTSGTLGGIDRSLAQNAFWRASEDTVTEALSIPKMETSFNNASQEISEPEFVVTTQALYEKYGALAQSFHEITHTGAGGTVDVSWEHYRFKGKPLFYDRSCPANQMYFLNTEGIKIHPHRDWEFSVEATQTPANQPVHVTSIHWWGNVLPHNPRLLARLTNKS